MTSTVEQLSATRVKLTIDMSFDELKPVLDRAYKDIAAQVNVPGFRQGKVPAQVIDQRFGRGVVLQEAINQALPGAYANAIQENNLTPLGQPEIDITKLEDGDLVQFTAEVDVRPEFDLPDFSDIEVEVDAATVSDDDIDEQIDIMRQRFATTTEVDRAAKDGDVVTIDLLAQQDGETLDDGTAEGVNYRIGAGGMLDGLDDAVTGLSAGESTTFTSELVGGPHVGEQADITVTVHKVSEQELPEVDDEFASMISQFDTVDEMKADLRSAMERQAVMDQLAAARDKVLEIAVEKTEFPLPENLVAQEQEARRQQVGQQLAQAGMTLEQYLELTPEEEAENEEDFWSQMDARGEQAMRAQIILDKLVEAQLPEVSQEDLTQLIFAKAQQNGVSPQQEIAHMQEHDHMGEWMQEIRRSKVLATLVEQATIRDTDGNTVEMPNRADDQASEEAVE